MRTVAGRIKTEKKRERFAVVSEVEVNKGSVRQAGLIKYLLRDKHQPGAWLYCPNPCREKRKKKKNNSPKLTKTQTSSQHLLLILSLLISPDLSFLITWIIPVFTWSQGNSELSSLFLFLSPSCSLTSLSLLVLAKNRYRTQSACETGQIRDKLNSSTPSFFPKSVRPHPLERVK